MGAYNAFSVLKGRLKVQNLLSGTFENLICSHHLNTVLVPYSGYDCTIQSHNLPFLIAVGNPKNEFYIHPPTRPKLYFLILFRTQCPDFSTKLTLIFGQKINIIVGGGRGEHDQICSTRRKGANNA